METTLRATYSDGVFIPLAGESLPDFPESAEVEITVRAIEPAVVPTVVNDADMVALLREISESMKANTFVGDPPRFTREELHERR